MTSRFRLRLASTAGLLVSAAALAGCGDSFHAGPMKYVESEQLATELKDKPDLQGAVRKELGTLFGADPQHITVPASAGSTLPGGGIYLGNYQADAEGKVRPILLLKDAGTSSEHKERQEGGYGLYRKHCLHCHGVSGAGDGPTAPFLYPRPRDYRKGIFKFTSTNTGQKPTRDDLRKTIRYGLHGTSMPAFEALMSDPEIEQVIDYMTFLSVRGETELSLINEAATGGELPSDVAADVAKSVFAKWQGAEGQVVNPPVDRTPPTRESVLRGRELFLGRTTHKLECTGCHGAKAMGDGPSFVRQEVFNDVVFGGDPSTMPDRVAKLSEADLKAWKGSVDDWGNPLRPNNLNRGVYKGGRRPIDIYWRIAKGINGAKMPGHYPAVDPEKIWDIVNFVLALPYEPALLDGATLPGAAKPAPAVANR